MSEQGQALTGAADTAGMNEIARALLSPAAVAKSLEWYQPDVDAYKPEENNAIVEFKEAMREGNAVIEFHSFTESGIPYKATLDQSQCKEAWRSGLAPVLREHFHSLQESGDLHSLREDDGGDYFGTDPTAMGSLPGNDGEFLPLGNGPFNRQLYLNDQWDMQAKAFWARTHDPVAKRALELIVDFTLGRGVKVLCNSPIVQDFYEKLDKVNKIDEMLPVWVEDMGCDGEAFFRFPDADLTVTDEGELEASIPKFFPVDPSTIWEIVTDPENISDVKFYWQQYQTPYQLIGQAPVGSEVGEDDANRVPTYKYVIRYIPSNQVAHFKINASAVEKRGRSDLFPVLGWLKRLRSYYDAETMKALLQAAFVFDITLAGGATDANAVKQFSGQVPPPDMSKPGNAFYHNEAVKVEVLQGKNSSVSSSTGNIGVGDGLLGIIAVGLGFAKDYLGVTSRGSRATALVSTEPAVKHFERRQKVIRYMLETIIQKCIEIAIKNGALPRVELVPDKKSRKKLLQKVMRALKTGDFPKAFKILKSALNGMTEQPLDRTVRVIFPDIVKGDRAATIKDVKDSESMGYFSKRRAANLVAAAFEVDEYDFDEEQEEIQEEGKQIIAKDSAQVAKGPMGGEAPSQQAGEGEGEGSSLASGASNDNNSGDDHSKDNPQGEGGNDIRDDHGPQNRNKEAKRSFFKIKLGGK